MRSTPLRILSFESRRASEMASLVERQGGGRATVVPSMREIPLSENRQVTALAQELRAGNVDMVVFTTGVGTDLLFNVVERYGDIDAFTEALGSVSVVVRGPKPTAVLKRRGVAIDWKTPEPNTWRETLAVLSEQELAGKTIAVQEYGKTNRQFAAELEQLGATVWGVPVYRWELPEDVSGLESAVNRVIGGEFDACLFTSAQQFENVLTVAERMGQADPFLVTLRTILVASIGPTCSEALQLHHVKPDIEASPPKMGYLVRRVLEDGPPILAQKRPSSQVHSVREGE